MPPEEAQRTFLEQEILRVFFPPKAEGTGFVIRTSGVRNIAAENHMATNSNTSRLTAGGLVSLTRSPLRASSRKSPSSVERCPPSDGRRSLTAVSLKPLNSFASHHQTQTLTSDLPAGKPRLHVACHVVG